MPFPPPKDLSDPGIKPTSSVSPALQVDSLPLSHWRHPAQYISSHPNLSPPSTPFHRSILRVYLTALFIPLSPIHLPIATGHIFLRDAIMSSHPGLHVHTGSTQHRTHKAFLIRPKIYILPGFQRFTGHLCFLLDSSFSNANKKEGGEEGRLLQMCGTAVNPEIK